MNKEIRLRELSLSSGPELEIRALTATAADGFSLSISPLSIPGGSKVALIGANGAGKSTFLEALLGLRSHRGDVAFDGLPLTHLLERTVGKRRLGVQFQTSCFSEELQVRDVVGMHTALYGSTNPSMLERLGLSGLLRRRLKALSGGERQRLSVYFALAHSPDLAVLDEPITGLDGSSAAITREEIRRLSGICLMSTHNAGDLMICDFALWLKKGKVCCFKPPIALLEERLGRGRGEILLATGDDLDLLLKRARALPGIRQIEPLERGVRLFGDDSIPERIVPLASEFAAEAFSVGRTDFGDLLRSVTSEGLELCAS